MKRWTYSINTIYKKCSIHLEEIPVWAVFLEELTESFCNLLHKLRVPGRGWWCWTVHNPINSWIYMTITKTKFVDIDYDVGRKLFYNDDKWFWDNEETFANEEKQVEKAEK